HPHALVLNILALHGALPILSAYERALSVVPGHVQSLEALANIAFERREWRRAWELYTSVLPGTGTVPADIIAYRRGVAAESLGMDREALETYSQAVKLAPRSRDALAAQARVAMRLGELTVAVAASEAQLQLVPPDDVQAISAARLKLAELCQRAGDADAAIHYGELVLAENARSQPALRA